MVSQEKLGEFLSSLPPVDDDGDEVEAMLTKFVLIMEWIDGEGNRHLVRRSGNAAGEGVAEWDISGMLHHCLTFDLAEVQE